MIRDVHLMRKGKNLNKNSKKKGFTLWYGQKYQ